MTAIIPTPTILVENAGNPFVLSSATGFSGPGVLAAIADRFRADLAAATEIVLVGPASGPSIWLEMETTDESLANLPATCGRRADGGDPQGERYRLTVTAKGVTIRACAAEGIQQGLTSLFQLAITSPVSERGIEIPPLTVEDSPRFAWRGLSFDVVRCFFPVETVKQVIDLLALFKANVLHLHITDHEGWRLEIDAWPKLTEVGGLTAAAGRTGGFYTKDDYREIVAYAAARGITVVPEFDLPGHTASIFAAYPELAGDGSTDPTAVTDQHHYFQWMHPDNPLVFGFITDVLTEIAVLTPGDYIHIGGDEALGMDEELYVRFVNRVREIVQSLGKQPVGWQEIARSTLEPGAIVQEWIPPFNLSQEEIDALDFSGTEGMPELNDDMIAAFTHMMEVAPLDLPKALAQGADIILSQASISYLDSKYGEASVDPAQEADRVRLGLGAYPQVPVSQFFAWEPGTFHPDLPEDRIVGVEAGIWCETITNSHDLFFMLLPRLPGVLEKGWSPAADQADPETWSAYAAGLAQFAPEWERRGLSYFRAESVWGEQ